MIHLLKSDARKQPQNMDRTDKSNMYIPAINALFDLGLEKQEVRSPM